MKASYFLLLSFLTMADPVPLPPIVIGDLYRFPDYDMAMESVAFAGKHLDYLSMKYDCEPQHRWLWGPWRDEAYQRLMAWECLLRIHRYDTTKFETRLENLSRLRDMIGHDAFYFGNMPYCVPVEWFPEIGGPPPERPAIPKHPDPPKGWHKAG